MVVYDTRKYETSRSIDHFIERRIRDGVSFYNLSYLRIFDDDRTVEYVVVINDRSVLNQEFHWLELLWLVFVVYLLQVRSDGPESRWQSDSTASRRDRP